ncbi:response regulator transcription factor [Pseudomonas monteilii]|uniref:response regulator transcription factor n=1 Tax=Pseudomonas monteilii TaxID=76759 RepID=UPI001E2EB4DE|nr:sigma factor-like helix-turn-helix DNA-binding protein [Pseudomonas monteilii]MCE0981661.1 LuxR C-terminal-related transcriptional regulator [Pseudomonas monteilii]MDH0023206.1 LuxR C-terminal-related transcriptional regulator [Pseudomonas monteilii]WJR46319.1 sigma factor-like helix-turn-helix DNA-binding protein [Pseudomonas monteilii]
MTTQTITANGWTGFLGMGLAPRELEATLHAASDLTQKEIARLMGISPKTVEKRIEDARLKLGARTMRGLVIEAFRRQIIAPSVMAMIALLTTHAVIGDDQMLRVRRSGGEKRIETRLAGRRIEQQVALA